MARTSKYPNDAMTKRVQRALRSGRKMRLDADGWYADAETGEPIGPDPEIERPMTKAQLGKATVRRGRPPKAKRKQSTTLRLDPEVLEHFRATGPGWQTRIGEVLQLAVLKLKSKNPNTTRSARAKMPTVVADKTRKAKTSGRAR